MPYIQPHSRPPVRLKGAAVPNVDGLYECPTCGCEWTSPLAAAECCDPTTDR